MKFSSLLFILLLLIEGKFLFSDVIIGPYLISPSPASTAAICWQSNEKLDNLSVTLWDEFNAFYFPSLKEESTIVPGRYRYCSLFKMLPTDSKFFYKIAGSRKTFSFRTPPEGGEFSFAVMGDTRSGDYYHREVVNLMEKYKFNFYFNTGDMDEKDYLRQWDKFFTIESPLLSSHFFYPVEGNHDVGEENITLSDLFYFPPEVTETGSYYSFWVDKVFFMVASTEKPFTLDSLQYHWMVKELSNADKKKAKYKFMFYHRPPFTSGPFHKMRGDEYEDMAGRILAPLAIKYHVTIVFNGHEHLYERSYKDGVYFITTGGGGAPPSIIGFKKLNPYSQVLDTNSSLKHFHFVLVKVKKKYIHIKAIAINGDIIDNFYIGEKPPEEEIYTWGCTSGSTNSYDFIESMMMICAAFLLMKKSHFFQRLSNSSSSRSPSSRGS